jgi:hypothetical protein
MVFMELAGLIMDLQASLRPSSLVGHLHEPDQEQSRHDRESRWLQRLQANDAVFKLHHPDSSRRAELEAYIRSCFARAYKADVNEFAPLLLELSCASRPSGVAGVRSAADTPLFLEHYLAVPVEEVASQLSGSLVRRNEIIELCNLAAFTPGACQLINIILAASLHVGGFRYAGFAGTAQLERIVRKQKFVVTPVAVADPARLGAAAAQWGSYYDSNPNVLLVDLEQTVRALSAQAMPAAVMAFYAETIETLALGLRESSVQPSSTLAGSANNSML